MTYDIQESGTYTGYPIELYRFVLGAQTWHYTSADEDKDISGTLYESAQITRSRIEQGQEIARAPITITCDKNLFVLNDYRAVPPARIMVVTLFRYHEGDTEIVTQWTGRVVNVKFLEREAEIQCDPIYTSLRRPMLRRFYQRNCPHTLYSVACGAIASAFRTDTTLTSASGVNLTSPAFDIPPDGYYAGGYVEWLTADGLEVRFIQSHVGDTITVDTPFHGIPGNAPVSAYPGCDHTLTTCTVKFANILNYGGFPWIPTKNPFTGGPIF